MTPARIRRAAEILREEARALQLNHYLHSKGWVSEQAHNRHDELLSLAIELDLLAGER